MSKEELVAKLNEFLPELKGLLIRCGCSGLASLFESGGVVFVACERGLVSVYWVSENRWEVKPEFQQLGMRGVVERALRELGTIPFPIQKVNFPVKPGQFKDCRVSEDRVFRGEYIVEVW